MDMNHTRLGNAVNGSESNLLGEPLVERDAPRTATRADGDVTAIIGIPLLDDDDDADGTDDWRGRCCGERAGMTTLWNWSCDALWTIRGMLSPNDDDDFPTLFGGDCDDDRDNDDAVNAPANGCTVLWNVGVNVGCLNPAAKLAVAAPANGVNDDNCPLVAPIAGGGDRNRWAGNRGGVTSGAAASPLTRIFGWRIKLADGPSNNDGDDDEANIDDDNGDGDAITPTRDMLYTNDEGQGKSGFYEARATNQTWSALTNMINDNVDSDNACVHITL